MKIATRPTLVALLASAILVACSAPGGSEPSDGAQSDSGAAPTTSPAGSGSAAAGAPEGIPDPVWAGVLEDLATRVGDGVVDPTVVSATPMEFSDGSWDCPEEGMSYTQAIVDGYRVVVEVNGEEFDYRSDGSSVRFCDPENASSGG